MQAQLTVPTLLAQDGGAPEPPGGGLNTIFLLVFLLVFMYLFIIRPQKKEADEKRKLLESLKKNDRVVTSGGLHGTIVNLKDEEVTLRVDDQNKVKIRFDKSAIAKVVGPEPKDQGQGESKKS